MPPEIGVGELGGEKAQEQNNGERDQQWDLLQTRSIALQWGRPPGGAVQISFTAGRPPHCKDGFVAHALVRAASRLFSTHGRASARAPMRHAGCARAATEQN